MRSRFLMCGAHSRLTPRRGRRGFTLPEMLIVVVMIAVLALVAVPRFALGNGRRNLEAARMRVAAGIATARQAAIQKGQPVRFMIKSNRVTVIAAAKDTVTLMSPAPLDTLYGVRAGGFNDSLVVNFSARGFAVGFDAATKITLQRSGVPDDSVLITRTGMVQR
jgi:prepilin-type N-terminal cleavage/methylation domain-containing protein